MKQEILVLTPLYEPTMADLQQEFIVHKMWAISDLAKVSAEVRGAVTTGMFGFTRRHIEALPRLEIIGCIGIARGTVDLDAARQRGIVVTTTSDFSTPHVADVAMGLLISVMRRIVVCDRFARSGRWRGEYPPVGTGLYGKRCGIVGLGKIGKAIARRAEAFDMSVSYHGPQRKNDVSYAYHPDLEEMAREADCMFVTCPASRETHNLISDRVLEALGPDGFLINVARGSVVDECALVSALKAGRIAGAGLDVFANEPCIPAELVEMENVVLLPHIGTATREIRHGRGVTLLANLRAHFSGQPVLNPVV